MDAGFSYKRAGVDIDNADATKLLFRESLATSNPRVLNSVGAFASLFDIHLKEYDLPVLVLKSEEPGSKQLLAAQHGRLPDVAFDLIHHLLNDTIVMGAKPLGVLDTIVCGRIEKGIVADLVAKMALACRTQGCDLIGGETSEQPGVVGNGVYILSATAFGIVNRDRVIDGRSIREGDSVLAVSSNGLHTNGYSIVRALLAHDPTLSDRRVGESSFLDAVLVPHRCYNLPLQNLFGDVEIHGLAHITGGGIVDNTTRILHQAISCHIDLGRLKCPEIFGVIQDAGKIPFVDMLRTYNLGAGLIAIVPPESISPVRDEFARHGHEVYEVGEIVTGSGEVRCEGVPMGLRV